MFDLRPSTRIRKKSFAVSADVFKNDEWIDSFVDEKSRNLLKSSLERRRKEKPFFRFQETNFAFFRKEVSLIRLKME